MNLVDLLFVGITALGSEGFYLLAFPMVYWCVDPELGFQLCCGFLSSAWANAALKSLFRVPRPPLEKVRLPQLHLAEGWSFPSGHAQGSACFWGYISLKSAHRRLMSVVGVVTVALVSFSRVYLGVHWPVDVVAGALLGYGWALATARLFASGQAVRTIWLFVPLLLFALFSDPQGAAASGALQGIAVGHWAQTNLVKMNPRGTMPQRFLRYVLGIGLMALTLFGLKLLLPDTPGFRFLRYAGVALGATFVAPWLFVKVGLACGRGPNCGE
ncbi:MAG: phosphatase PAP2 family protein [Bacillota bacterium]